MAGKYFNYSEVLSYGWNVMKANLLFFVGLGLIFLVITYIPDIIFFIAAFLYMLIITCIPAIMDVMGAHPYLSSFVLVALKLATIILDLVISIVLGVGLIKIALSFCDKQKPAIGTLFDVWDCFWRYAGAAVLYGLIVLGGTILLIIPGIIWAIKYSLCYYFVVDKGIGPVDAIKASGRTTMGVKWRLLGFVILCGLINLLGLLCLLVGIFAAYPIVLVSSALVYRQLVAQTPELAEFGIVLPSPEIDAAPLPNEPE
jgi:uncharacterized membrane protein